jgi:DNA-binding NarL/FixJ family response regulator
MLGNLKHLLAAIEDFTWEILPPGTLGRSEQRAAPPAESLTRRELDTLRLLAAGMSNQEIAGDLAISVRTVERHITNLYSKIGARGRADATAYALRARLA